MFANVHILKAKQNEDRKYIICLLTLKVVKLLFDQSIHGKTLKKFQNSMSANLRLHTFWNPKLIKL